MTNQNDNAFPYVSFNSEGQHNCIEYGLTKREYFAAMAMQALIHSHAHAENVCAENAVIYADALIKQLNESK